MIVYLINRRRNAINSFKKVIEMDKAAFYPAGDSAILIKFEQKISSEINGKVTALVRLIKEQQIEGIIDMIPSFCALLVNYDSRIISYEIMSKRLSKLVKLDIKEKGQSARIFEIPTCYGGDYGPDINHIAEHAGLSIQEVIDIHSSRDYLIYMLGFMPGFSYLGGLDERIHTPRLETPRVKIRGGSVGIAGGQTGIYPLDSPGGWQLLGLTPVKTYDPKREIPILYNAGDYIRFIPVGEDEFLSIKAKAEKGDYQCRVIEKGA
jgi:KipI family sensor histidine kinase inhibitor